MEKRNIKQQLKDLERRAKQRQKKMPSIKPDTAVYIENKNSAELMTYVYKTIGVVE